MKIIYLKVLVMEVTINLLNVNFSFFTEYLVQILNDLVK